MSNPARRVLDILEYWHKVEFFIPFDLKQVLDTPDEWTVKWLSVQDQPRRQNPSLWKMPVPEDRVLVGFTLFLGVFDVSAIAEFAQGLALAGKTAFAEEQDCVIVATSTLELGIDVGDLDYVIQIDSPSTVSSFLQRMGRTGRRKGSRRNCLFLTTTDEAFLLACSITTLWREEYVEDIKPPPSPWHMVAQQIMAIALERPGHPSLEVLNLVRSQFPELHPETISAVFEYMVVKDVLFDDAGRSSMGVAGERIFGRAHFLDLLSAFASPMVLTARHGATELGSVDPAAVQQPKEGPTVLLLGGRSWKVASVDWPKRVVWVEPSTDKGKTRWLGTSRWLSFDVCQAMYRALTRDPTDLPLSRRAVQQLSDILLLLCVPSKQLRKAVLYGG